MLVAGGHHFAQHVGRGSAFELIEFFRGPPPEHRTSRDPLREAAAAEQARLTVTDLRTARCRMEFFDIGAVVWILRKCVWWVPTSPSTGTATNSSSSTTASGTGSRS